MDKIYGDKTADELAQDIHRLFDERITEQHMNDARFGFSDNAEEIHHSDLNQPSIFDYLREFEESDQEPNYESSTIDEMISDDEDPESLMELDADLSERFTLGEIDDQKEKVKRIVSIVKRVEAAKINVTEEARRFLDRFARPVSKCLRNHYHGDICKFAKDCSGRLSQNMYRCRGNEDSECGMQTRTLDFPERFELTGYRSRRRTLKRMLELDPLIRPYNTISKRYNRRSYGFLSQMFVPVMSCLQNHFRGNVHDFLQMHGQDFKLSTFRASKCCGKYLTCSPGAHR